MKLDHINVVSRSLKQLVSSESTDELCRTAVECLLSEFDFDRAGFSRFDKETNQIVGVWGSNIETGQLRDESSHRHDLHDFLIVSPTQAQDGLLYKEDVPLMEQGKPIDKGWHIQCAIFDQQDLLGWIFIDNLMSKRKITETDIESIRIFTMVFGPLLVKFRQTDMLEKLNNSLADKNDHLEQAIQLLTIAQKDLVESQKMEALGHLVRGVAHELNTPLGNALMSISEVEHLIAQLKKEVQHNLNLEEFEYATQMTQRNLIRAATLIKKFKHIAINEHPDDDAVIQIDQQIRNIIRSSTELNEYNTHNTLFIRTAADAREWSLMSSAFDQVISNLISNAYLHGFKNTTQDKKVIVTVYTDKNENPPMLHIEISDNGRGVDETELDFLFDPFFTKNRQKGVGLGMSIVYNLVTHLMGGTISARLNDMGGLSVELRLPAQNQRDLYQKPPTNDQIK